MRFVCYSSWDQLPESANALFEQEEKDSIFFSRTWFERLASTALDENHAMLLACVVNDNNVLAILPLMTCTGNKTWYSLRHGFSPLYNLLLTNDDQERVLSCLAQALSQLPIKGLLLEPVAANDRKTICFQRFLDAAGFSCEYIFRHYNWVYRLQGQSYAAYMAARPGKLRNTISRKKRKLEREHGYEIRLFTGDEVPHNMPDYYVVYNASWKQNEEKNADLMDDIVDDFSRAGWSRLAILYIKAQPVAAQLWFVQHDKASIFRLAYDKAWRQYSTGSILTSFLMEYVIDTDKVEEIDFLTGNDAYKQDWMSERRERFLLSCVKSLSPASRYERFIKSLTRMLKRK